MKDEEIRMAIAEACGTLRRFYCGHCREERGNTPNQIHQHQGEWFCNYCDGPLHQDSPDYPNDLNAMHEAELHRDMVRSNTYSQLLQDICFRDDGNINYDFCANARQRAEAFLRTLGKWKEQEVPACA